MKCSIQLQITKKLGYIALVPLMSVHNHVPIHPVSAEIFHWISETFYLLVVLD